MGMWVLFVVALAVMLYGIWFDNRRAHLGGAVFILVMAVVSLFR